MGMNNEPPRCQECQELSFSIKRENKIIPQICNAERVNITCMRSTPVDTEIIQIII